MTAATMRLHVLCHGTPVFQAGTYDEVHAWILQHHRARLKACGFRVELSTYEVVDNHDAEVGS